MITIKRFVFNSFQVNTFVLTDEGGECLVMDPACDSVHERQELSHYIESQRLRPVKVLLTHCHVDHIVGVDYVTEKYGIGMYTHRDSLSQIRKTPAYASVFGLGLEKAPVPEGFFEDGEEFGFGNSLMKVLHTPGHCTGSLSYACPMQKFVFTGDALFRGSIGRTDLPTGNFDLLMDSLRTKLLALDDDYVIYPGHGPESTIGDERKYNPFLADLA